MGTECRIILKIRCLWHDYYDNLIIKIWTSLFYFFIGAWLLYNAALVSAAHQVNQPYAHTYPLPAGRPRTPLGHHRAPRWAPRAAEQLPAGCLFYACMKLVTQSCPTLCDPMDRSLAGSSVQEIPQAGILEWITFPLCRVSSWPRDQTPVSCMAVRFWTVWATWEVLLYPW